LGKATGLLNKGYVRLGYSPAKGEVAVKLRVGKWRSAPLPGSKVDIATKAGAKKAEAAAATYADAASPVPVKVTKEGCKESKICP
jgi:hypothetical protein